MTMRVLRMLVTALAVGGLSYGSISIANAADEAQESDVQSACGQLPSHAQLHAALAAARAQSNGGFNLFGLQASNPVNTRVAYRGESRNYGNSNDPMVGGKIGGVNVFGGGLALYNAQHELIGGIGVSGDSSCADHNIAWRTRHSLVLDFVPAGVSGDASRPDNIVYDIVTQPGLPIGVSASGWGHAACSAAATSIANALPAIQ